MLRKIKSYRSKYSNQEMPVQVALGLRNKTSKPFFSQHLLHSGIRGTKYILQFWINVVMQYIVCKAGMDTRDFSQGRVSQPNSFTKPNPP